MRSRFAAPAALSLTLWFSAFGCSTGSDAGPGAAGGLGSGVGGTSGGAGAGGLSGSAASGAGVGAAMGGGSSGASGAVAGGGGAASLGGSSAAGSGVGGGSTAGSGAGGGSAGGTSGAGNAGGTSGAVDAVSLAAQMGVGTNIGNTLENTTTWETGWGQPLITQAFINGIASRGIKTVRVPVAWDTYATNGQIDAAKLARVKEVVGWIDAAGMYSIVNIHWDGGWIFNESNANKFKLTSDVAAKFASYWTQIAGGLGDVGHRLILEGLNEEGRFYTNGDSTQPPDYAALNQLNQLFVTTVRAQSGYNKTRALLVAGFNTDIELTCVDAFSVPTDPAGAGKLFVSLHYYTPYTFCGLDTVESWGSPAITWGTAAEKSALEAQFSKLSNWSQQKHIPVILGEFAVTRGEAYVREPASRSLWMESVAQAALSHGMVPVLWDTGSEIKRSDGSFSSEFQTVMDHVAP